MKASLPRRAFLSLASLSGAAGLGLVGGITATVTATPTAARASTVGGAISRAEVLARAQWWIDRYGIIYSQNQADAKPDPEGDQRYRPDCSGFVSMAWHLPKKSDGWDRYTGDLAAFGDTEWLGSLDALQPGDAILGVSHVALFDKWVNASRTQMWIYEEFSTTAEGRHVIKDKSWYINNGFRGLRYKKIVDNLDRVGPVGLVDGAGMVHAFARGTDNSLKHWYWSNGWKYDVLGGGIGGSPSAISHGGIVHVFAQGTDSSLKHWYWSNGWKYDVLGGGIVGSPSVISDGAGMLHIFAQGTDNSLKHWYWSNGWKYDVPGTGIG